jgi:hypothetical protein
MRNGQHDEGIELHEHRTAVVDVPLAQGIPVSSPFPSQTFNSTYHIQRYYNRRELQIKKEKEKEDARKAKIAKQAEKQRAKEAKISKNATDASTGSSQPPPSNVTQQLGEGQTQPTPESHSGGITTLSTTPATSTTTSHWTRFRSVCCCASAQNADGRH